MDWTIAHIARFADPTSHRPAEPEQKEQELKEKHAGLPSQGYHLLPAHWALSIISDSLQQHFTYLSHVFFHWLYSHEKTLSSDFPKPSVASKFKEPQGKDRGQLPEHFPSSHSLQITF